MGDQIDRGLMPGELQPGDEISVDLRILTARRTDLICDRTRTINRLSAQLLPSSNGSCPEQD
ncbi:hypothetical protein ACH347_42240 [Saccharopolyspora sp. 5N102]|uniref:hypothetical protein n=1 Tax=Saccharopolyspora sp. 5N102 TaxID=3375155 RepID=UPI003788A88A